MKEQCGLTLHQAMISASEKLTSPLREEVQTHIKNALFTLYRDLEPPPFGWHPGCEECGSKRTCRSLMAYDYACHMLEQLKTFHAEREILARRDTKGCHEAELLLNRKLMEVANECDPV